MSAITIFEDKQVRRAWNATEEKWYFAIDDVVQALTGSGNVKDYIKKLRKRDPDLDSYWGTNCPLVEMTAADGKQRKIKAANTEALLRIIQSVPSQKAEPFKRWLAKVGYERLEEIENPELIFTMLGEASTTEIAKKRDARGFPQNKQAAHAGGTVAGNARRDLESHSGTKISTKKNFKALPNANKRITRKK